jgi:hypothetical protein
MRLDRAVVAACLLVACNDDASEHAIGSTGSDCPHREICRAALTVDGTGRAWVPEFILTSPCGPVGDGGEEQLIALVSPTGQLDVFAATDVPLALDIHAASASSHVAIASGLALYRTRSRSSSSSQPTPK